MSVIAKYKNSALKKSCSSAVSNCHRL